jgi:hypothetical protein
LEAKHVTSRTMWLASSSIRLSKEIVVSFLKFELMDMTKFSALVNNQWSLDWFKMQVDITRPR